MGRLGASAHSATACTGHWTDRIDPMVRSNNTCAILSGTLMDTWEALPPDVCVTFVTNVVMVRLVRSRSQTLRCLAALKLTLRTVPVRLSPCGPFRVACATVRSHARTHACTEARTHTRRHARTHAPTHGGKHGGKHSAVDSTVSPHVRCCGCTQPL